MDRKPTLDTSLYHVNTLIVREQGASYLRVPMPLLILDCLSWVRELAAMHENVARGDIGDVYSLRGLYFWKLADDLEEWADSGGRAWTNHPLLVRRLKLGPPVIDEASLDGYVTGVIQHTTPISPDETLGALWLIDEGLSTLITSNGSVACHCGPFVDGQLVVVEEVNEFAEKWWRMVMEHVDEIEAGE